METWKDIPNYEGIYQASTEGRIRSVEGKTTVSELHGTRHWKPRILKMRGSGRKIVSLWKSGKSNDFYIHRLIALTFLGEPPDKKTTVNHKDGNPNNNNVFNLEWVSRADNIRHGFNNGLYHTQKPIRLKRNGEIYEFNSLTKAGEFLGRSHGYLSDAVKFNRSIKGGNGAIYEMEE